MKQFLIFLLCLLFGGGFAQKNKTEPEEESVSVTFMVYMDAATLESGNETFASYDLTQMLEAELTKEVTVLIETGSTSYWGTEGISTESTQRFRIENHELVLLEDLGEQQDLTDAQSLEEFLIFAKENAPADRYMLLMWGHGRGPEIGYGMDDFGSSSKSMTACEIAGAIEAADIPLELLAFDACLMGTLEIYYELSGSCEYLAVSEDYEPAYGWQYTQVLTALSENPKIPMEELSEVIVDSYLSEAERSGDRGIMTVLDCSKAQALWEAYGQFRTYHLQDYPSIINRIWSDPALLTPVPASPNGYVSDDDDYSLWDYHLTDLAAICEQVPVEEQFEVLSLLDEAIVRTGSFHMARRMSGLAVLE